MFNNLIPSVIPLFHPLCHSERSEESLPYAKHKESRFFATL